MRSAAYRANLLKLGVMALLALAACAAYLLVDINPKYFDYAMSLRTSIRCGCIVTRNHKGLGRV